MFAILLHENMDPFYQTVSSFPTVIFTGLLLFCVLYWAVAVLGLIDIDFLDLDLDGDIDPGEGINAQSALAGLIVKLGLHGVPFIVALTILSLIGWVMSFYSTFFLFKLLPDGWVQFIVGIPILVAVFFAAAMVTAIVIRPLRKLFSRLDHNDTKHIIGQVVVVRSALVNSERGQGLMADGGADLVLDIRSTADTEFKKGDEVVVFEQLSSTNTYRVISKSEFDG